MRSSATTTSETDIVTVDVCLCTYHRESVVLTLQSVMAQALPPGLRLRVIVADNSQGGLSRQIVEECFAAAPDSIETLYVEAPHGNISVARNACLAAATADFVAFLDDDEVAACDWLAALMAALRDLRADIVFGPVRAVYEDVATPGWMIRSDFHSFQPVMRRDQVVCGYTSNVLMRREAIRDLRFDLAYGRSGGEDLMFFNAAAARGARMRYTPTAKVYEPVGRDRLELRWLLRRNYRSGITFARMAAQRGDRRWRTVGESLVKTALFGIAAVVLAPSPRRRYRYMMRCALRLGAVAKSLGYQEPLLYGAREAVPK